MKPLTKLAIVVAVQVVILLSILGFKQYTVWTGETVRLAVAPVDPRDPLRGDYVTLAYDISRLDPDEVAGDDYPSGTVYVELREADDGLWEAVAIHEDRDREFDGTVLLKGKVEYVGGRGDTLNVRYGIEELFIPEGSGGDIPWDRDVAVELKVDRFGNAVVRHLLVDGEKLDLERR
jgi:uncharacterized membrane-anchored protein